MLLTLLILNILSNAVTILDNRQFYYSRNITMPFIILIISIYYLCFINIPVFISYSLLCFIIMYNFYNYVLYIVKGLKKKSLCVGLDNIKQYSNLANKTTNNIPLNPWWVTGFSDAEGSFSIIIFKNTQRSLGWRVMLSYKITLHVKDVDLLYRIKDFYGVGNVNKYSEFAVYKVDSREDLLNKIIPHFDKYPLITQKWSDYILFKEVLNLIYNKKITLELFKKILNIKSSHNKGLSQELLELFPATSPVIRPVVPSQEIQDPNWLTGFVDGDGCFFVKISKSSSSKLGYKINLQLSVRQHNRDVELLKSFINYLNCGNIYESPGVAEYRVSKISDILEKIIPFFKENPLQGDKILNFEDFIKVSKMCANKEHLTSEGLKKIQEIKSGMNTGRED